MNELDNYKELMDESAEERAREIYKNNARSRKEYEIKKKEMDFKSIMQEAGIYEYPLYAGHKSINGVYIYNYKN